METQDLLITTESYKQIKDQVMNLWEQAHGNPVKTAHMLSGENYLAVFLTGALSKAETNLIQKKVGKRLIKRYLRELMDWVMVYQVDQVEQITGRPVGWQKTYLDPEAGWIMFYFTFDKSTSIGH